MKKLPLVTLLQNSIKIWKRYKKKELVVDEHYDHILNNLILNFHLWPYIVMFNERLG